VRSTRRWIALTITTLALAALASGCDMIGYDAPQPWEPLASGHITGDESTTLDLGVYELGERIDLGWELSGPDNPPVTLELKIVSTDGLEEYSTARPPQSNPNALSRKDGSAMGISYIEPGSYRIFFSQRFRRGDGPGYDIDFTVYALRE